MTVQPQIEHGKQSQKGLRPAPSYSSHHGTGVAHFEQPSWDPFGNGHHGGYLSEDGRWRHGEGLGGAVGAVRRRKSTYWR